MNIRFWLFIFLFLFYSAVSCFYSPAVRIGPETRQAIQSYSPDETRPQISQPRPLRTIFHQKKIEVQIQQSPGFNVGNLYMTVYERSLYLTPLFISSGAHNIQSFYLDYPTEFSFANPPQEILWVTTRSYSNPWSLHASNLSAVSIPINAPENPITLD